jgi:hypothetical protein
VLISHFLQLYQFFAGGAIRGLVDMRKRKKETVAEDDDLDKGSFCATGLVAGGALAGVAVALLTAGSDNVAKWLEGFSAEHALTTALGSGGYQILGVLFFAAKGLMLYRAGMKMNNDEIMKS